VLWSKPAIMRFRVIVLLLCTWAVTACDQDGTPILRGTRLPDAGQPAAVTATAAQTPAAADHDTATPVILNLTLPDYEWDDLQRMEQATLIPDVFTHQSSQTRLNWSGRLHLDESDAAATRPIQDTILGAEVEVQLRLP